MHHSLPGMPESDPDLLTETAVVELAFLKRFPEEIKQLKGNARRIIELVMENKAQH